MCGAGGLVLPGQASPRLVDMWGKFRARPGEAWSCGGQPAGGLVEQDSESKRAGEGVRDGCPGEAKWDGRVAGPGRLAGLWGGLVQLGWWSHCSAQVCWAGLGQPAGLFFGAGFVSVGKNCLRLPRSTLGSSTCLQNEGVTCALAAGGRWSRGAPPKAAFTSTPRCGQGPAARQLTSIYSHVLGQLLPGKAHFPTRRGPRPSCLDAPQSTPRCP